MGKTESTEHMAAKPEMAKMAAMGGIAIPEAEGMADLAAMVATAPQAKAVMVVMVEMQTDQGSTGKSASICLGHSVAA